MDLVAVIRDEIVLSIDGLHDNIIVDVVIEDSTKEREEWFYYQRELEIPIRANATDDEMAVAVKDTLVRLIEERDAPIEEPPVRERRDQSSELIGKDIRA